MSFPCRYKAMTDSSDQPLCYFHSKYGCKPSAGRLQNTSRISKIIECSKIYGDTFHETLEELYINDPNITLQCHKNWISRYVSPCNTRPYLGKSKCSPSEPSVVEPKRLRSDKLFDFKKHCLFCPDVTECTLSNEYPRKVNVTRRKAAYMLRSDKRCDGSNYKQQLVLVCDERGDHLGKVVKDSILGAVSDLHAADARYHVDCHRKFFRLPYKCKKSDESDKSCVTTKKRCGAPLMYMGFILKRVFLNWRDLESLKRSKTILGMKLLCCHLRVWRICSCFSVRLQRP